LKKIFRAEASARDVADTHERFHERAGRTKTAGTEIPQERCGVASTSLAFPFDRVLKRGNRGRWIVLNS
jgi:hypothetical protein